ncbi:MAG: YihY/virulence factor BrkB family protein [Rhodopirellula sp.]|nr:YihY/virulence factor BrkB family protein [Rhodopirellula sp.]
MSNVGGTDVIRQAFQLLRDAVTKFDRDDCLQMAAALAYYTVFSLPPMLIVVTFIASLMTDSAVVQHQIQTEAARVIGENGSEQMVDLIEQARQQSYGPLGPLFGITVLLLGATGVLVQLQASLNRAWDVTEENRKGGITGFILSRLLSFALLLTLTFILLISVMATALIEVFQYRIKGLLPGKLISESVQAAHWTASAVVITLLFAAMYKWLPARKVEWRDVWFGAIVTGVLMTIAKIALGIYLGSGHIESAYGAAGALVLVLAWVYYSAIVLLFGAELTQCRMKLRQSPPDRQKI